MWQIDNELMAIENIANLYKLKSDYDKAMTLLQEQQIIASDKNMLEIIQANLGSQAEIYIYRGEYDKALPLLKEQERINQNELDNQMGLQQALGNQAKVKCYQMEYEESLSLLLKKKESV